MNGRFSDCVGVAEGSAPGHLDNICLPHRGDDPRAHARSERRPGLCPRRRRRSGVASTHTKFVRATAPPMTCASIVLNPKEVFRHGVSRTVRGVPDPHPVAHGAHPPAWIIRNTQLLDGAVRRRLPRYHRVCCMTAWRLCSTLNPHLLRTPRRCRQDLEPRSVCRR